MRRPAGPSEHTVMKKRLMLLGLPILLAGAAAGPGSGAGTRSYLILASESTLPAQLDNAVRAAGGTVTHKLPAIGVAFASSSDAGFAARAARIRGIRSLSPNATIHWIDPSPRRVPLPWPRARTSPGRAQNPPTSGNDDPLFDLQWGLHAVKAPKAWAAGQRGATVRVAVLDTGVDADHPDLAPNVNTALSTSFVEGQDFDNDFVDFDHGSHVAGIVAAADNGVGVIGVAPEAEIVAVKVLNP